MGKPTVHFNPEVPHTYRWTFLYDQQSSSTKWKRLYFIAMYAASVMSTQYCRVKCFLDWSQWQVGWMESSPDGINGYIPVTKASLQVGGHWMWLGLEKDAWPGLLAQDMLLVNESLSGFESRHMEEAGQVVIYAATLWSHPGMRLMMMKFSQFLISVWFD